MPLMQIWLQAHPRSMYARNMPSEIIPSFIAYTVKLSAIHPAQRAKEANAMAAQYEQKKVLLDYFRAKDLSPLPHLHKELELIYIRKGSGKAVVNNKTYSFKSGDLILTFPYQIHYYPESEKGEYYVHAFPASVLITMSDTVNGNELLENLFHPEEGGLIESYLKCIIDAKEPYAVSQRCAFLTLILAQLLPECRLLTLSKSSGTTLRRILEYCASHYSEELSLDTLAQQLHLNKYYISHSINQQLNMRISAFINSLRIEAACRQLQNTDRKVSEIAQSVGFETIRSFNRAFSEIVHMTPKEYREKYYSKSPENAK
jgi:AraC-like DNA-binding protein